MTHYLYKPHVHGPEYITTPDLLVDKLYRTLTTQYGVDLISNSVNEISSNPEIQCTARSVLINPAYFLVAAGGGVIVSIGAELSSEAGNAILVSRFAWRFKYLADHIDKLVFDTESDSQTSEDVPISKFPKPQLILEQFSENEEGLPRGIMICATANGVSQHLSVPSTIKIRLSDHQTGRSLNHTLTLSDPVQDRWEKRPSSRYTVGPTSGELTHYI